MSSNRMKQGHPAKLVTISLAFILFAAVTAGAQVEPVRVIKDAAGMKLQVDGRDFMVFGMNWGYMPIGENYAYDFWGKPDEFIQQVLADEMPLLQNMGVNTIRQYAGIPPRWVKYIYETYGIYTVVNHPVARWGFTLDGVWHPQTDYSNPRLRQMVKDEVFALVEEFENTPGMLMWLLGNENNYGLSWASFEIEALPEGERNAVRARFLYSLMGELIDGIHERDSLRPVCMANGDVQYIDIIAEECKNLDIFGSNQYRGISVRDMNDVVKDKMNIPLVYTEFGSDAFNARTMQEDQAMQAKYLIGQWQEIYERSYGKGLVGNAVGGMIFQWADGWWKFRQEERLNIHDTNASWPNAAYPEDYVEGENNMNEEWWGICAKGPTNSQGYFKLYPRAAYYALAKAFKLDPYAPDTDLAKIRAHFGALSPATAALEAMGDKAALNATAQAKVRLAGLRMEFETFSTGATVATTPENPVPGSAEYPSFVGFDQMESFYATIEAKPAENVLGSLTLNVLGSVPGNPIDEIFYENRGRSRDLDLRGNTPNLSGEEDYLTLNDIERVKVYQGSISWDDKWFELQGFYRTGHLHWGFEGDFFGLYRNAYYGENIDIYNGMAPVGFEIAGKKSLRGLKAAFGPQLWWGANPAVFLKYQRQVGRFAMTGIVHEDIAAGETTGTSGAQNLQETRKASLQAVTTHGPWTIVGGALWSGSNKVGDEFKLYDDTDPADVTIRKDRIKDEDAWGFKGKLSVEKGAFRWYGQGAYMGLVADAGPTEVITFTGWKLKDSGSGNQKNVITGFTYNKGNWQIGPNFLWQKPIVGPIPGGAPDPGAPRNLLVDPQTGKSTDPFAVLWNREMTGAEILLTYDPHPATWFYAWDNVQREGARFAFNLGFVYKDMPTTRDALLFYAEDGRTQYAFEGGSPGHTEWEIHSRITGRLGQKSRLVANVYAGQAEPNGWIYGNPETVEGTYINHRVNKIIHRYGADARLTYGSLALAGMVKINDWGIYDYHHDWNYTYPLQLMGDVSWSLGSPAWFDLPNTRMGIRGLYRTLDKNSNRYFLPEGYDEVPTSAEAYQEFLDEIDRNGNGSEWEIRTYVHLAI
ncbi:MAG: glycoside hydrolase family 2 TIM barrel-domain containing protein [bacterium]